MSEDIEKIIKDMKSYLTNMSDVYYLDKRQVEILLKYIREINEIKDMYGYFLSVVSSNMIRFRKYRENKSYRIKDFDRYNKYMEDEKNE